jgi:hypothetical protein
MRCINSRPDLVVGRSFCETFLLLPAPPPRVQTDPAMPAIASSRAREYTVRKVLRDLKSVRPRGSRVAVATGAGVVVVVPATKVLTPARPAWTAALMMH